MITTRSRFLRIGRIAGISLILAAVACSAAWLGTSSARSPGAGKASIGAAEASSIESMKRVQAEVIVVPFETATRMGLRTAMASLPSQARTLPPFSGTLAIDQNALSRVYSRFPGEVVSLGTTVDPKLEVRNLRVGDRVTKGQALAVVSSVTLGEKKSELVDALSKLRRDEDVLAALLDPASAGSVPPRSIRDATRDVESDRVAVARAERTLRSWGLSAEEVAAIRGEASDLAKPSAKPGNLSSWPLSVLTAPRDGILIEHNTSTSAIVDPSTPLFLVADLSHLAVWAHVYEEDLPLLQSLPQPTRWTVNVPSRPGTSFAGTLDTVGAVIHPDQHTAMVSGVVANADGSLRSGMFVTVTVELPPVRGEIEIPSEALIEDGRESIVFVRSATDRTSITRQRVKVIRRFQDVVYLATSAGSVRVGDEVITAGSLLLNEAMNELPAPHP